MRSSPRSFAALFAVLVFLPAAGAFAEDTDVEGSSSDGVQIVPAGAEPYVPKAGNLNSVPEDGISLSSSNLDSPLVKQILASRPNEDLVICIAGCYSGANRVIYAQPSAKALRGSMSPQSMLPADPQKIGMAEQPGRATAANRQTPVVINRTN
jgi:hypothetical protein